MGFLVKLRFITQIQVFSDNFMTTHLNNDKELYSQQFKNKNKLVGQTIKEIIFFLEETDKDFTEQPNEYGKSLLSGIDIKTGNEIFSIGNRYTNSGYGLSIDLGQTNKIDYLNEEKKPSSFDTSIVGQTVLTVDIFWMKIPFEGATGFYPQEIEIVADKGYLLFSSIEVNSGQVNTEFTNELLIIDNKETAKQLKLGQFGVKDNDRKLFYDLETLIKSGEKN